MRALKVAFVMLIRWLLDHTKDEGWLPGEPVEWWCIQSCPTLYNPMNCGPASSSVPERDFPGKNNGVGCHFLGRGIFLTQGSNLHLSHLLQWHVNYLALYHLESPIKWLEGWNFQSQPHLPSERKRDWKLNGQSPVVTDLINLAYVMEPP